MFILSPLKQYHFHVILIWCHSPFKLACLPHMYIIIFNRRRHSLQYIKVSRMLQELLLIIQYEWLIIYSPLVMYSVGGGSDLRPVS